MTTPSILIGIVFVLCLAAPVATRSVGLVTPDDKPALKNVYDRRDSIKRDLEITWEAELMRFLWPYQNYFVPLPMKNRQ